MDAGAGSLPAPAGTFPPGPLHAAARALHWPEARQSARRAESPPARRTGCRRCYDAPDIVQRNPSLFTTTTVGSLPKPDWLAEPEKLCGRRGGSRARRCSDGKRDAALDWLREQEDAGIDIVTRRRAVPRSISCTASSSRLDRHRLATRRRRWASATTATSRTCPRSPAPLQRAPRRCTCDEARFTRAHTDAQAQVHPARPDDDLRHASPTRTTAAAPTWRWPSPSC